MSVVLDRVLAAAGLFYSALRRRGRWAPRLAVAGLMILTLVPVVVIGSTKQPTAISLADFQTNQIPSLTSWFRFDGDLRPASSDAPYTYTLHDPTDDARAITVVADAPLETGRTEVTGRVGTQSSLRGTFQTIEADVPTEPVRHDPWFLYGVPGILAGALVVGSALGYPIVRPDSPATTRTVPLRPGERLSGRWAGWIGNERVALAEMSPCTVAVSGDETVSRLTLTDPHGERTVPLRRAAPKRAIRICRTSGCKPGLELRAQAADVVLVFDDAATRDWLALLIS